MTQTIDQTLAERGSRYGEFTDHAEVTQEIKRAMAVGQNWEYLPDDMRECLEMIAHKVGRILNGDPDYIDSWTDIIGYTRLVEKRLIDEQAPPTEDRPSGGLDAFSAALKAMCDAKAEQSAKAKPGVVDVEAALATLIAAGVLTKA